MITKKSKIFIAGHKGMVGSAIARLLNKRSYENIIIVDKKKLDLSNQLNVNNFLNKTKPDLIINCAALVGGILENKMHKADIIYQNTIIQTNLIHSAYKNNIRNMIFLGSSCIYANNFLREIKEEDFLNGPLEKTNDAYSLAKINGIKMCQSYNEQYSTNYISLMPCNLFGINDKYDLNKSHVIPALIKKIHIAKKENRKEVIIWGTGKPLREFLFTDDLADAILLILRKKNLKNSMYNIGSGDELKIIDLAKTIKKIIKYEGKIIFDKSKPDGTFRKKLNIRKITNLGWKQKTKFIEGLKLTYKDFLNREKYAN